MMASHDLDILVLSFATSSLMPNKKQPGAHGRWCGRIKSHGALLCNNPSPTGRICVRPRASFIRPRG